MSLSLATIMTNNVVVIFYKDTDEGGVLENWEEKRWSIESIYDSGLGICAKSWIMSFPLLPMCGVPPISMQLQGDQLKVLHFYLSLVKYVRRCLHY